MPTPGNAGPSRPTAEDAQHLLAFRVSLRRFQHWSETQARAAGLTHAQHQLLVAVKGQPARLPPTVGQVAAYLMLRHHSAGELVDRAEAAGLVSRMPDQDDARVVRVNLTSKGDRLVTNLARAHLAELHKLTGALNALGPRAGAGDERTGGNPGGQTGLPDPPVVSWYDTTGRQPKGLPCPACGAGKPAPPAEWPRYEAIQIPGFGYAAEPGCQWPPGPAAQSSPVRGPGDGP